MKPWHTVLAIVLLLGGGFLWLYRTVEAQRPSGSDDMQIRTLIDAGAKAATRRDSATLNGLISDDYKDGLGFGARAARAQIARVLRESKEVQVFIPSDGLKIQVEPDGLHAYVQFPLQFTATMGASPVPFSGQMNLRLAREPVRYFLVFPGQEWRVVAANGFTPDLFQ